MDLTTSLIMICIQADSRSALIYTKKKRKKVADAASITSEMLIQSTTKSSASTE